MRERTSPRRRNAPPRRPQGHAFTPQLSQIPHLLMPRVDCGLFATASTARRGAERSLNQSRDELDANVQERTT